MRRGGDNQGGGLNQGEYGTHRSREPFTCGFQKDFLGLYHTKNRGASQTSSRQYLLQNIVHYQISEICCHDLNLFSFQRRSLPRPDMQCRIIQNLKIDFRSTLSRRKTATMTLWSWVQQISVVYLYSKHLNVKSSIHGALEQRQGGFKTNTILDISNVTRLSAMHQADFQ